MRAVQQQSQQRSMGGEAIANGCQEEEGENKLPCGCGAPSCRGTLN